VSNFNVAQMEAFRAAAPLHTIQPPHNLFERGAETDVLPYSAKHDIASLAYGPLCRGLLSGKITASSTFTGDDLRRNDPKFKPPRFAQYLAAVAALEAFAKKNYGKTVLDLAIRWVLDRQPLSIALWGARKPSQLDPIAHVSDWKLDAAALAEIDQILADNIKDPVGPEFMAPPVRKAA
jgi:aryl-alcohol dehydrogenase-like predicted oxidoreductase